MKKILLAITVIFLGYFHVFSQAGAGVKFGKKHQEYVDSIKNSDYKWIFPAWGKKITKKGFDIPYPVGIMLNSFIASQKINITDLKVGINDKEPVPLDFIKFGEVSAVAKSLTVRPDVWILPFMDVYGIAGITGATTKVSVVEPFNFNTEANFSGSTFGLGTTFAGGYHGFIGILDINHTWSTLENIKGTIQTTMVTPRVGMSFLNKNKPNSSVAFWVGSPGFFVNRVTEGTINLSDLTSNASKPDLENITNEVSDWYNQLPPAQKIIVKEIAQKLLDKINGLPTDATISYSLIKKPTSNWSMCVGGQYQFSHRWQVRTEFGFFGGRKSVLLSGNYRFRW